MATYSQTPTLGVNFDEKSTNPTVKPGTTVTILSTTAALNGRLAMYVYAPAAIGNSSYSTVDMGTITCTATSVDGGSGTAYFRNGSVAFAAGEYGWLYSVRPIVNR